MRHSSGTNAAFITAATTYTHRQPWILLILWVARDDARNYIVFGDPAVRLRVDDLPVLA